jgi:predicted DNA-binding transcriptional regulator YafY
VLLQSGFWYLVGHDHARDARRTFRIDRIAGDVTVGDPISVERPDDFDPATVLPRDPKLIGDADGEALTADVWIDESRAAAVVRELGPDRVVERRPDGSVVVSVPCANRGAFRSWVLGFVDRAEVIGPPEVRTDIVDWLEALA